MSISTRSFPPDTVLMPHYAARPGASAFEIELGGRLLAVPVRQLGSEQFVEIRPQADDVLLGAVSIGDSRDLELAARNVYSQLIDEVRAAGFPYFVRMWNYVGTINEYDGGRERYQLFCAGRHDAFVAAGYHHDVDLPAASAVGMPGRGLVTYFLAARQAGEQVENPRQIAAYHYPPQYGVKSPSFSRATIWNDVVFVSGTSSVVGHATVHQGDVLAQLDETLRNIEIILARTGRTLENVTLAKTYVRNPHDFAAIAARLDPIFPSNVYLHSDICRRDLLLEIEAIAR